MERVVIFGTGKWYSKYKEIVSYNSQIVYLFDNNTAKWGTMIDGIPVVEPASIDESDYDYVILMSIKAVEMKRQLIESGVSKSKILFWEEYRSKVSLGDFEYLYNCEKRNGKSVMIITTNLGYNGGSMAAINAAEALGNRGYNVTLCTPEIDMKLLGEIKGRGYSILIAPEVPYIGNSFKEMVAQFDAVLVSVFQMIRCAAELSEITSCTWWIHESSDRYCDIYPVIRQQFEEYDSADRLKHINVVGVSRHAAEVFRTHYPELETGVMSFGIPDDGKKRARKSGNKRIFALVANIEELKGQHVLIDAVEQLDENIKSNSRFLLIGNNKGDKYYKTIIDRINEIDCIEYLGMMSREQLYDMYSDIDVIICASYEETMSATIVEGMMNGKICITSDNTGIAQYINDGCNGYVYTTNDAQRLKEKIEWIFNNFDECKDVKIKARITYENNFTMDIMADNLIKCLGLE